MAATFLIFPHGARIEPHDQYAKSQYQFAKADGQPTMTQARAAVCAQGLVPMDSLGLLARASEHDKA